MNINETTLVKGAVAVVVGLPLSIGGLLAMSSFSNLANVAANTMTESKQDTTVADFKAELTGPCVRYLLSKGDSKLEREAKNELDDILGGEVVHSNVCKWVI